MPTALIALQLLAAAVAPRLAEPLRLLDEVQDNSGHLSDGGCADVPRILLVTMKVARLPPGTGGTYAPGTRTVTMADKVPRVLAANLAHELEHALDADMVAAGIMKPDCIVLEARTVEAKANVIRALWPDELPDGTDWAKGLAMAVNEYESGRADGLRATVGRSRTTGRSGVRPDGLDAPEWSTPTNVLVEPRFNDFLTRSYLRKGPDRCLPWGLHGPTILPQRSVCG